MAVRLLHGGALASVLAPQEDDAFVDPVSAYTHIALIKAATPGGITLFEPDLVGDDPLAAAEEEMVLASSISSMCSSAPGS